MTLHEALPILRDIKKNGRLILFIGSGISMNSGLPSWDELMSEILNLCENIYEQAAKDNSKILSTEKRTESDMLLEKFKNNIDRAGKELKVHPIWTISVLKEQLETLSERNIYNTKIAFYEQVLQQFLEKEPHDYHKLIIESDYPVLLTSNYDNLLQKAAKKLGKKEYSYNVYDFNQPEEIANKIYYNEPFIFHVHGKIRLNDASYKFEDIILTKDDYQRIRKNKPAVSQLLRTLFLNYTVLFIGYGANDPHVNDIFEEMAYFFPETRISNQHFIIWNQSKGYSYVQEQFNRTNRLNFITINDWSEYSTLLNDLKDVSK